MIFQIDLQILQNDFSKSICEFRKMVFHNLQIECGLLLQSLLKKAWKVL